jgi:glycopeptide antibiotics resistance protein
MIYINSILTAIVCFPILSLILTLPFLVYYYRKYGSISFLRGIIFYSFCFYLLCTYFLIILPLPRIEEVANYTGKIYNLKPFYFVPDFITSETFDPSNIKTYLLFFKNSKYMEALFNILLTIPFGIYLRYYFKCNTLKTIGLSFLLSLFFELTQLTGLYFIYPRPYRLFDINDLINNTLGGTIGYIIAPILNLILPSRNKLDEKDTINGNKVTFSRRICALIIDYIIIIIAALIINILTKNFIPTYLIINLIYFTLIPLISEGYTFGSLIVKYKTIKNSGKRIDIITTIIKWLIIHLIILNSWTIIYIMYNIGLNINVLILIYIIGLAILSLYIIYCTITEEKFFYDKILNIEYLSLTSCDENEKI